ncbi:FAD-dependent oxidoreductase [Bradyrhizobium vignae]|uniref:2-polyprenyl-6-methoxyphenol hydroxylase-like oxidoreductase n=1 Tax=Bradyrhizobium vignae TaxID=1549949 RepID=A0A2U3Q4G8_9BRAD|nr:NAD(P)/FAD-dependent oxidoreductase [Bradyrhizobium vignae]SPP96323.1 2-polyprenyl-6-methoxyphenol hydroxylase-like oxidoreductase [Bradyrhizobium vignae]
MTTDRTVTGPIDGGGTAPIVSDIAIVGGGLAGSLAAAVLARAGHRVALVDKRAVYPDEFRVEKIGGHQLQLLRKLGFLSALDGVACRYQRVLNIREGKVVDVSVGQAYGFPYADLVAMARSQIPDPSNLIVDEVTAISSSDDVQHLELASGRCVTARLVVLATGMAGVLGHKLGIRRRVLAERHSVSFGFTIARKDGRPFDFEALTCYGERTADGIDYLSLFPVRAGMRANLFMFRDPTDPIMRELRREPEATVLRLLPGLQSYLGDFRVTDRVQNWVMDLTVVEGHLQPGVVLIGDAFQTNCPAAGTGVARLLVDVDRLCTEYVPRWLMTAGMGREKISQFYSDRDKIAADQQSLKMARFRQALTSRNDIGWNVRRRLHFLRRSLAHRVDQMNPGWLERVRGALRA